MKLLVEQQVKEREQIASVPVHFGVNVPDTILKIVINIVIVLIK